MNQKTQAGFGAATKIMSPAEIADAYPFYNLDGIICGSHNLVDEGYFDSGTMFDWWRRKARANGVEYVKNEVVGIGRAADRIDSVTLASGETVAAGTVVNAAGPSAFWLRTWQALNFRSNLDGATPSCSMLPSRSTEICR